MKIYCVIALCLLCIATGTRAQLANQTNGPASIPADTTFHIVERGANHRVWQRETYEKGLNGKIITHVHKYTEISTGMHVKDSQGQWVESQELIESFQNGAIARHGRHQVAFAKNLNTQGAVAVQMPDQRQLAINVLGLAFHDNSTGSNVLIAQIQDSTGELISSNQVLYPNAFNGINADVRYTYRRSGFEQDVILREQPPDPASLGLNPDATELEVMTEFLNPPKETIQDHSTRKHPSPDQDISWGSMFIGHGKAFDLGDQTPYWSGESVFKQYITTEDGRKILVEIVPWKKVHERLTKLPKQAGVERKHQFMLAKTLPLPKTPVAKKVESAIKLASLSPSNKGYVLDYNLLDATTNDFTFQSDTTYLITGNVSFNGTTTFEGGTVIKYSSDPSVLQLWGPAVCKSSEYRPIVMTSQNDNSVGDYVPNSGPLFVLNEFSMNSGGTDVTMEHLRCSYADVGVHPTCPNFRLTDAQFFNCGRPLCPEYVDCQLNNVLMAGTTTNVFWGGEYTVEASHFTVDGCQQFTAGWDDSSDDNISFTNSLLIGINSFGYATVTTNYTVQLASDTGVFQAAGGGGYYLATNSPYRSSGTTNIDPGFLADIADKTTYPPVVYSFPGIQLSSNLTLNPQAPRDTNASPDLGYHYDPLDYVFGETYLTNATITVNPGTTVGLYSTNSGSYGICAGNNSQFVSIGAPNNLNYIVAYNEVQEQTPYGWIEPSYGMVYNYDGTNFLIDCRFTDFSSMAHDAYLVQAEEYDAPLGMRDCQFHGGSIISYNTTINLTNCLLERVDLEVGVGDNSIASYRNNTFWNGIFLFGPWQNNSVVLDNLFDGTSIPDYLGAMGVGYIGGHNAYVTNCNTLDPTQPGDIILSNSPAYQTSWLGNYYLPPDSPLINTGSTTADKVGLYQFTTQTNQLKEGFTYVDVGYHYVAVDPNTGQPYSTYTNSIPDYIADSDGNGLPDAWEIQYFGQTGQDALSVPDAAGWSIYQEYVNGMDPTSTNQPAQVIITMPGAGTIVP